MQILVRLLSDQNTPQKSLHLKPEAHTVAGESRSPSPSRQTTEDKSEDYSTRNKPDSARLREPRHSDVGFADAVSDVVDLVRYDSSTTRRGRSRRMFACRNTNI